MEVYMREITLLVTPTTGGDMDPKTIQVWSCQTLVGN